MVETSIKDIQSKLLDCFDCGEEKLNIFLKQYAKQNESNGLGRTYLIIDDNKQVVGFYTLSSAQIAFQQLPTSLKKNLPKYPIPAIRIARLAVDKNHQRKGIGSTCLKNALKRILCISLNAGVAFVLVDAKPTSKAFYEHYGFVCIDEINLTYILPISTILSAVIR